MAVDERTSRRRKGEGPSEEHAGTSPPQLLDWSWLPRTLMGLQKTVGELSRAVAALTGRVDGLEEKVERIDCKVDRIDHKLDRINHGVYAAVFVLAVIGATSLWILNDARDRIIAVVNEALVQTVE